MPAKTFCPALHALSSWRWQFPESLQMDKPSCISSSSLGAFSLACTWGDWQRQRKSPHCETNLDFGNFDASIFANSLPHHSISVSTSFISRLFRRSGFFFHLVSLSSTPQVSSFVLQGARLHSRIPQLQAFHFAHFLIRNSVVAAQWRKYFRPSGPPQEMRASPSYCRNGEVRKPCRPSGPVRKVRSYEGMGKSSGTPYS